MKLNLGKNLSTLDLVTPQFCRTLCGTKVLLLRICSIILQNGDLLN